MSILGLPGNIHLVLDQMVPLALHQGGASSEGDEVDASIRHNVRALFLKSQIDPGDLQALRVFTVGYYKALEVMPAWSVDQVLVLHALVRMIESPDDPEWGPLLRSFRTEIGDTP